MLNSLKLRPPRLNAFVLGQSQPLEDASARLATLAAAPPSAPLPHVATPLSLPDAAQLQAARDDGDAQMCAPIDWLARLSG